MTKQLPCLSAVLEIPVHEFSPAVSFWSAAVGKLISAASDVSARISSTGGGASEVCLELHVADPDELLTHAVRLGAVAGGNSPLRSPGGLAFAITAAPPAPERPTSHTWPDGSQSVIDQVCLDIPPHLHEAETEFWAALTEWEPSGTTERELTRLDGPGALRLLLQRLDDEAPSTTAHLDFACTDVETEVARQEALGASRLYNGRGWVTMQDPIGLRYCITGRLPRY